jgi:hypothetical protein
MVEEFVWCYWLRGMAWCWMVMKRYGVTLLVHWVEIDMN